MPKPSFPARPLNRLLARLPAADFRRLFPRPRPLPLAFKRVLCRAGDGVDYAYFPTGAVLSELLVMGDGRAIEVATVGDEGMTGLGGVFGAGTAPHDVLVQVGGDGLRLGAAALKAEAARGGAVGELLARYHSAYQAQVSYSVACNGLHTVQQRCCRWLLITRDRVGSDVLPLTHEFLAIMLGVRRSTVTEVLHPFQGRGLISNHRGRIRLLNPSRLEAESCECYRQVRKEYDRLLG